MKMVYLSLIIILIFSEYAYSLNLTSTALCDGSPDTKSQAELDAGKIIGTVYKKNNLKTGRCLGWSNLGGGDIWYEATRKMDINAIDVNNKLLLANWPLTRWKYLKNVPEIAIALRDIGHREIDTKIHYTAHRPFTGCTNLTPLRYGDIENDGINELVLTLNGQLIVFSPEHTRTIFAEWFDASDWYREPIEGSISKSDIDDKRYQYISETFAINGYTHKAFRAYSKLYVGDYDKNGHPDIVVWRKLYESNTQDNTTPGFTLIRSSWLHFERNLVAQEKLPAGVTGEYLPQATDATTIQTWLSDNNLTWSKGYPDFSECKGQEGKLIPEMHDPLLNDPDVLK